MLGGRTPLILLAPQVGFEPTTLRLTVVAARITACYSLITTIFYIGSFDFPFDVRVTNVSLLVVSSVDATTVRFEVSGHSALLPSVPVPVAVEHRTHGFCQASFA